MMKKLVPAALLLAMLTGCGTHVMGATNVSAAALAAQSKAQAEKAIHTIFKAAFKTADKNQDGKLTLDEMPGALPTAVLPGGAPVAPANADAAKALFEKLDVKKVGYVGFREFCAPANQDVALGMFRSAVGLAFAQLDKDGDRSLAAADLLGTPYGAMKITPDKKGRISLSAFEDGVANFLAAGADPAEPDAPPAPPAPPAPDTPPTADPANDHPAPPPPAATKTTKK